MAFKISMYLRLTTSTLFPYTTLFRSLLVQSSEDQISSLVVRGREVFAASSNQGKLFRFTGDAVSEGDRKSTRLNSSHMSISYAVFCLKKKTDSKDVCSAQR